MLFYAREVDKPRNSFSQTGQAVCAAGNDRTYQRTFVKNSRCRGRFVPNRLLAAGSPLL